MKSYTDLEQSKKLANILPIESADMHYNVVGDVIVGDYQSGISSAKSVAKAYRKNPDEFAKSVTPCWSLAALFDVIPKEVKIKEQRYAPCLFPIIDGHWLYKLWYNSNEIIESPIAVWCDNPVDACYKMILKLKEYNLL